jgi:predicted permease
MEARPDEAIVTRLQRALVRWLAPREETAGILDDLEEEAAQVGASHGAAIARRWVRWQIAHSAGPWLARRFSEWRRRAWRSMTMMHRGWGLDLKVAARRLSQSRGFTALACLTLAIGISAVSTVFSLAYALWLKPLPYHEPDRLVWLAARHEPSGTSASLTVEELRLHQSGSRTLEALAGFVYGASIARVNGEPVRIVAHYVSPNLFRVLGVRPAMGRDFSEDDATGGGRVVMLSHQAWVRRFAGDPAVIGTSMMLDGEPGEIVGVMPPGFTFPRGFEAAIWRPAAFSEANYGDRRVVQVVARLAGGRALADAALEAETRMRSLGRSDADGARWGASVTAAGITASRTSQLSFQALLGIVGLFLLIACTNLAGLLLARNAARRTELAICLSIGASRWRLARALFVESALVALVGCAAGILLTVYASRALSTLMPARTPGLDDVGVNGIVLALTAVVSAVSAVLIGLLPALSLRAMRPTEALSGSRTVVRGASRAQRALVVVEIALAVVLVLGAGVMLRAFRGMVDQDRGYEPRGLVALNVSLPFSDDSYLQTATRARFFDALLDRMRTVPGVKDAGATTGFPGSRLGILGSAPIAIPGGAQLIGAVHAASPDYFRTMAIPIKAGRGFTTTDTTQAPRVAIVNELLAREFPGGNPIGHHIPVAAPGDQPAPFEIVGVAGNIRLSEHIGYRVFIPLAQGSPYWIDLVLRGDESMLPAVRRSLRELNPDLLIENDSSFRQIISDSLALQRAQSAFALLTGGLSVIVAGVGLYALLSFLLAQQRRELGIRLALGSSPRRLFRDAMLGALRLVVIGIVAGEVLTAVLVRALGSRVFGLTSADAIAYAGAGALVLVVALIAAAIPARRVLTTDPLPALRTS